MLLSAEGVPILCFGKVYKVWVLLGTMRVTSIKKSMFCSISVLDEKCGDDMMG